MVVYNSSMKTTTIKATELLRGWIEPNQLLTMFANCDGDEGKWFEAKLQALANLITTMPATRGQEGKGEDAIVYLHYFRGSADWYITEKDSGSIDDDPADFQSQMFGYVNLGDDFSAEFGYISLPELLQNGVELDLHWKPRPVREFVK